MLTADLLTRNARQDPEKLAVITNERSINYGELDTAVRRLSRYLIDRGLNRGDRVALHWHNSVEYVIVMLAVWRAGLVLVPVNSRLKAAEIAWALEHSGARLCFSEPQLCSLVEANVEVLQEIPPHSGDAEPVSPADADDPAMILYTSGTTARPKGVVHTQRSLLEGAHVFMRHALGSDGRPLAISPLAHIAALQCVFLPSLIQNASAVLLRKFDAAGALDIMERFRCTFLFSLPSALQLMTEEQTKRPREISGLRAILTGGDSASVALQQTVKELFSVEMQEACGMTEVLPTAVNPRHAVKAGAIGLAVNGTVRVVDADGNDVEPGAVGEMVIRSAANCAGYWNDSEATAQLFDGGWLHTGDLVTRDDDGYLWFRGRLKQIIVRGGSNISPQEVEEALYQHPAVLEAGVVGMPDAIWGEVPVAFIALRAGCDASGDQLAAHSGALLADYKLPAKFFFADELPKGSTGKIDRRRLRENLLSEMNFADGASGGAGR